MLKLTDADFARLVDYMKKNYGINLEKKRVLIEGRLSNSIEQRGYKSFKDYIDFAFADRTGNETITLVNKLTTNHTFFMREPEHFEYLKTVILPNIEQNNRGRDFNVWCAASSTGQEPYSLIMTIEDYFSAKGLNWNVKLLATDIDTDVLKRAKDGIYSSDMLKDIKSEWMRKYFQKRDGDNFQVIDKLRNMIEFRQFNLMHPITTFKQYDLISCRNVMIYFDGETKNALVERFFDVTKEGGYFYIGHAESVTRTSRYTYVKPAVYRKITQGGAQKGGEW